MKVYLYRCGPSCDWVGRAPTVEVLIPKVVQHAQRVHDLPEPPPAEALDGIRESIRDD